MDKLQELAKTGFSEGAIEAAINTIEFSLRENNTGSFPRGLSLMLRAMGAWIYDRDPYTPIQVRGGQEGVVLFGGWVVLCVRVGNVSVRQGARGKASLLFLEGSC